MKNRRGSFLLIQSGLERWEGPLLFVSAVGSATHQPGGRANSEQLKPARGPSAAHSLRRTPLGRGRGPPWPRLGPGPPGGGGKPTLRLRAPRGSWGRTAVAPFKITSNAQGWTIGLMDLGVFWSQRCARSFGEWLRTKPGKAEARMAVGEGGAPHAVLAHAGPGSGGARAPPLQLARLVPPWAAWGGVWAVWLWWGPLLPGQRQLSAPKCSHPPAVRL